jgi:calcineurin-like phosphoesterase family protein
MWHRPARPSVPAGSRVYAVGDVHGRLDLLDRLLDIIDRDALKARDQTAVRVFLGDYIDRGPDSAGVIARLIELQHRDPNAIFLRGNHEQMLLDFMNDPNCYQAWSRLGGEQTLLSYDVAPPLFEEESILEDVHGAFTLALPEQHLRFIGSTKYMHVEGDYLLVHAGIRPDARFNEQDPQDLMWIREEFLSSSVKFEKVIVHGHSGQKEPVVRPNRIGIDTIAHKTGHLTALVLEGTKRRFLKT